MVSCFIAFETDVGIDFSTCTEHNMRNGAKGVCSQVSNSVKSVEKWMGREG